MIVQVNEMGWLQSPFVQHIRHVHVLKILFISSLVTPFQNRILEYV